MRFLYPLRVAALMCLVLFSQPRTVLATHAAGLDLTYKCLGGLQYEVSLFFYRDCAGSAAPAVAQVQVSSISLGQNFVLSAVQVAGTAHELTAPCTGAATACGGGSATGIMVHLFRDTIVLPAPAEDWHFSFTACCRNCAITTLKNPCTEPLYITAELDNLNAPGNNSPRFTVEPLLFACAGQPFRYNPGTVEDDGDSLVYALVAPGTGPGISVSYQAGNGPSNPLAATTFSFDQATGEVSFTTNTTQVGAIALSVTEYRNGKRIGRVNRDIQVYVNACSNTLPVVTGIDGTGKFTQTVYPGVSICFQVYGFDADSGQTVSLTHNGGIPGASFILLPGPVLEFCWTPDSADAHGTMPFFVVTASDDACPVNGVQSFTFSIDVKLSSATGITDPVSTFDFHLSPNPANGPVQVAFNALSGGIASATLFDAHGRIVQKLFNMSIPAAGNYRKGITVDQPTGLYFLLLEVPGGTAIRKLLVSPAGK